MRGPKEFLLSPLDTSYLRGYIYVMAKKEPEHEDAPQVSFTLLVDEPDMQIIKSVAKKLDRTRGYLVREAIRFYIEKEAWR